MGSLLPKRRGSCLENNGQGVGLVDQENKAFSISSIISAPAKYTSRPPARGFPPRTKKRIKRTPILAVASALIIFGLSYFASKVHYLVTGHSDNGNVGLDNIPVCDLVTLGNGTVQNVFTINIRGSAELSFTQAKAIDIMWQLSVGAGGKFLMGWIAYKAFMDGLTRLMEQRPVSYDLYATLTFSTTSLLAVWQATKTVFTLRGWRGKCFMIWFAVSTIYILGFQTLISATAGYVQPSISTIQWSDGSFVNFDSDGLTTCFVFTNAAKVGLPNDTVISGPSVKTIPSFWYPPDPDAADKSYYLTTPGFNATYPDYRDLLISKWASLRPNCTNWLLGQGILPVSPQTLYPARDCNTTFTFRNQTHILAYHGAANHSDFDFNIATCYRDKPLDITDAKGSVKCLPEPYFVWGLSSLLLKIVLALQIVWIFGTYVVWLDANAASDLCRHGRKVRGPFRAAEDLSEATREVLGSETCAYSDAQLADELQRYRLGYYSKDVDGKGTSHIGLTSVKNCNVKLDRTKLYGHREI